MKIVYLGTSQYAVAVLDALAASKHRPKLIVSMPDSKRGRGRKLLPPPVALRANELAIDLLQPGDINATEVAEVIAAADPDAVCVCAYGQLIKEPLLSDYLMLNVHPSLLPRWRGAAPIERALIAGDATTGVTIMKLTSGLDSGPIVLQEEVKIGEQVNYADLSTELAGLGGKMLTDALNLHEQEGLTFSDQNDDAATYADKITSNERRLQLTELSAQQAERWVRALTPHIGAYLEDSSGERLKLIRVAAVAESSLLPGETDVTADTALVGCQSGAIELLEVQPPGGKPMPTVEFLRGRQLSKTFLT